MIWLARHWKPIAVLVLLLAVYGWGRMDGKAGAQLECTQARMADYEAAQKDLEAERVQRIAAQRKADELAKQPAKVIERVRQNPSNCVLPRPVTDSVREQVRATNEAIRSLR